MGWAFSLAIKKIAAFTLGHATVIISLHKTNHARYQMVALRNQSMGVQSAIISFPPESMAVTKESVVEGDTLWKKSHSLGAGGCDKGVTFLL
jgi:hypothetical protein